MKRLLLILCLIAITNTAYAEANYTRTSSPLSVGETDKYFKDLNSWDSNNLYVPGQPYSYSPQVEGSVGPNRNTQPNRIYTTSSESTESSAQTDNAAVETRHNQGMNINSPNYKGPDPNTETSAKTRGGANVQQTAPRRWNKNASENHYNFGGTGFKSRGFGQGYGQN